MFTALYCMTLPGFLLDEDEPGFKNLVWKAKKDSHRDSELTMNALPTAQDDRATPKPLEG